MPKLDNTHLVGRIAKQIERLKTGEKLVAKDISILLSPEQQKAFTDSWETQQKLRKGKRATTDEEKAKLGWKERREVYIETLEVALKAAKALLPAEFKRKLVRREAQQGRIYFEALKDAEARGLDKAQARTFANNELTRNGLRRLDGQDTYPAARDLEVKDMEAELWEQYKASLSPQDRAQVELLPNPYPRPARRKRIELAKD